MLAHLGACGTVIVHAPAKLNLYFELLSRREDGYHGVETLMVPVSLFDTLVFEDRSSTSSELGEVDFRYSSADGDNLTAPEAGEIPQGSENIVVRAIELLRHESGSNRSAAVRLIKRIPAAAGLGGGSSDAAAALLAANKAWAINWPRQRLATLAAQLGSDVPFFLWRAPGICRGRGEQLERVSGIGDVHAVIVHPPEGLSTPAVYRNCRVPQHARRVEPMLAALRSGSVQHIHAAIHNRLQETAETMSPWIGRLQREFTAVGCPAHQMTGSGSSYFGICHHARHARQIAARLRNRKLGQVFRVRRAG